MNFFTPRFRFCQFNYWIGHRHLVKCAHHSLSCPSSDYTHLVGFLVWLTPVFYPTSLIPAKYSFFIYLNPIAGIIQGCRWAILGDSLPSLFFLPSFVFFIVLFFSGLLFFISTESDLADYI